MVCPTCKKAIPDLPPGAEFPPFFPFCSERCKLIDLGRWLDGKYQIPAVDTDATATKSGDDDEPRGRPHFRR
jgi:endogenous inhibitor of DNA gyrase (YacG/DUF329 family)